MTSQITSQVSTFMALSGLAATNALLDDPRPAWVWGDDGKSILWSNPAGAAFFGVRSLAGLADLSGLSRAPARPHIARVAASGAEDRDTTERLRFYRGLRVMLLTCSCRRLALPGGGSGALIIANDAPTAARGAPAATDLVALVDNAALGAAMLFSADGSLAAHVGPLDPPPFDTVRARLQRAKHVPVRTDLPVGDAHHAAAILTLDGGEVLVTLAAQPLPDSAPDTAPGTAPDAGTDERAETQDGDAPDESERPTATPDDTTRDAPAPSRRRGWSAAAGGLFGFASATRFLSPSPSADRPTADAQEANTPPPSVDTTPEETVAASEVPTADVAADMASEPAQETPETPDGGPEAPDVGDAAMASETEPPVDDVPTDVPAETADRTGADAPVTPEAEDASAERVAAPEDTFGTDDDAHGDTPENARAEAPSVADATQDAPEDASEDETSEDQAGDGDAAEPGPDAEDLDAVLSADTADSGFVFAPRGRPVRFAWKMDVDRRFTFLSPEFAEALGPEAADVVGLTWDEVAERFDLDRDGRVAAALKRRDTWSGRSVDWPVSGAALRVPVDMAALPAFDRFRVFEGFRGFGVCRTADAVDDPDALGRSLTREPPAQAGAALTAGLAADVTAPDHGTADETGDDTDGEPGEAHAEPAATEDDRTGDLQAPDERAEGGPDADLFADAGDAPARDVEAADAESVGDDANAGMIAAGADALADDSPTPLADDAPAQPEEHAEDRTEATPDATAGADETDARDDHAAADDDATAHPEADAGEPETAEGVDAADAADAPGEHAEIDAGIEAGGIAADDDGTQDATVDDTPSKTVAETPPATPETPPLTPPAEDPALATSRLSRPEREAFRKIAETLGRTTQAPADATSPDAGGGIERTVDLQAADLQAALETSGEASSETSGETDRDADGQSDEAPASPDAAPDSAPDAANVHRLPLRATGAASGDAADADPDLDPETDMAAGIPDTVRTRLLDRLPVGVAIVAGDLVGYANATLLDLLGFADLRQLNDAGGLDALFAEPEHWPSTVPGAETERTMRLNLADGSTRPVKARLHAVPWNGETALMMSLLDRHDPAQEAALDKLHEVQTALASAEAHLSEMDAVLETATDGVLILDEAAGIVKVNRSAEALFNASRDDMVGEDLTSFLAPESHRDARDYFDGLAKNGVASVLNDGREVIGQVYGGGLIPLFMTIGRVGAAPDGLHYCAVLRDITQWKTAEEELTDAKRQAETASSKKSDFLAKISHEIRTPLNAIIGFSEVMMEERFGPIGNDRYKGYLRDIHNSGSHIMSLINDLLDLSKIEAGKLDLTFEAVSANDIIRECVALMQPQANRERVIIRASLPGSVPSIVADGRSIRQVVLNLLSNAIKFNQPGGQVIVSTALEDSGEVILRVRDTGLGMSQKDLESAMEPFRQLHTARHGGGTGLGLPLTKALVEANRASFRIDSELNQGTLVEITFPPQRVLAE
ncbi:ATP-binding protein [Stappia sp.]|uniref:ATP-binding protein n=1 Tax=Stappia sp. TaxID=1870903 RepID=UPI0032D94365